ncbi:MAG: TCR/Tet family MFS transporter [Caulobacterales bacterium]
MAGVVQPRRRAAVAFVFVAVMLDMIALGIIAPVLPGLIKQLIHGDAALAARYVGWFTALWALMQFIFSPIIGGLSDRFGRRPVLLASMFGLAADYMVMALAPTIGWLLVGRIISGITSSSFSTANAYIADITPPEERAGRFGLLSAAFGIGFIGGPALGGLLGQLDPRLPFWGAGALCFLNGLYGAFVVPESLKKEHRSPFSLKIANPVGAFDLYKTTPGLLALGAVMFLYYMAHQVLQSTWIPYVAYRYHWASGMIGFSLVLVGINSVLTQSFVTRPFVARFGERTALAVGLAAAAAGFALYGWAAYGWLFLATVPATFFMNIAYPATQGLMSRSISAKEQGRLQGANTALMAIASTIGPILFTEVFAQSISGWAPWAPVGLAFYVSATFMLLALILAFAMRPAPVAAAAVE